MTSQKVKKWYEGIGIKFFIKKTKSLPYFFKDPTVISLMKSAWHAGAMGESWDTFIKSMKK